MNRSTRNLLRIVSVVLVLLLVLMQLGFIPAFLEYRFWFMVVAYGLLLLTSK
ncbi:MAG: hypothetical protein RIA62_10695 [Cyclobacteriaceae bacterium]